ncbi:DUF1403 family protein [Methylocystis hirsuta]|nr:DUF1403 family protein [Methylocystis hirsuta]
MLECDSRDSFGLDPVSMARPPRVVRRRPLDPPLRQNLQEFRPLPRWARLSGAAGGDRSAMFFAGAGIAHLDLVLRSGVDVSRAGRNSADVSNAGKNFGSEPGFSGALHQRLALKAAATSVRLARLREDEAALRDAEHLSGVGVETSPSGRVHRLWRLFATRAVKFEAPTLSAAAEHIGARGAMEAHGVADALRKIVTSANDPLAAAAGVSAAAMYHLAAVPAIEAEIFALWLADAALAQKLGWSRPLPLIATAIGHRALRKDRDGRRPRPSDPDWADALAGAYALSAQQAFDIAIDLSRRTKKLSHVAPKLRAKGAARVIDMLLADDCVSPARAAKVAGLSDRASRRLFDRLVALGAVRELSGRTNFRLYGL